MDTLLQLLVSGFMLGSVYALLALGVIIIMKATQVFNFAIGSFAMLGAYLLWTFLIGMHLPFWLIQERFRVM